MKTKRTDEALFKEHTHQAAQVRHTNRHSATLWLWPIFLVTAFVCLAVASECMALTTSPTALTFNAVQGATTPPNQTLSFYRNTSRQATLTGSDNASWLTVSPVTTSITSSAQLTVIVDTGELAAGTYNATITIKVGKRVRTTVPVTLIVSPPCHHHQLRRPPWRGTPSTTQLWGAIKCT